MQRESPTTLVTLVHYIFVACGRVAGKPHFRSKCKHSNRRANEQSEVNVYSWDERTGLYPVHVSESSPFRNQCHGSHLDLFSV